MENTGFCHGSEHLVYCFLDDDPLPCSSVSACGYQNSMCLSLELHEPSSSEEPGGYLAFCGVSASLGIVILPIV